MPKKCFVSGCSTGYDSNRAAEAELAARKDPISIFLFPKDDTIRKQWLQNISRDAEDKPQAKRYVCSLHFKNTDYETSKVCRGTERQVRSLKKGAVPTVFNNASYPSYMKDTSVKNRTTTMSSSVARREGEWTEHEQETEAWLASDRFNSLEDLKDKVAKDLLPDFRLSLDKDELGERQYLTIFTYKPQQDLMPAMDNILRITDDGTFVMYKHGARISKSKLRNIIRDHKDRFTMVSQVTNAVAFLKNYQVEDSDQIKKIEEALEDLDLENISMEHQQLFSLIKMQVSLCQKPKNNRKYTSEFLIKCAILYRSSPKMYRLMRKEMGLIVPDESTDQRVTRVAAYKGGIDVYGDIKVEEEECVSIDQYTDNIAAENYVLKEENEDEFECKIESEFLFSEQEQRVVPDSCSDDFSVETRCEDNQPRRKLLKRQHNDSPTQVDPETLVKKKWKYLRDQFVKPRASKGNFSSLLASDAAGTSLPGSPQQGYQMDDMEPPLVSEESMSASPPHTQDTPVHEDEVMDKHRLTSASSYLKKKGASKRLKTEDYNQSILDIEREKIQYLKEKSSRKQDKDDDEDLMFFKSLLPHVKRIPVEQKLTFRGRIQEIVQHFAYQVPITSPSPHTYGSSAPPSVSTPQVSPHSYTHSPLEPHSYTHSPLEPHSYTHSPLEPQNVATDSYNISLL